MAKCLVLGANGFIGSHLVDELVQSGHSVRAFSRTKTDNNKFNSSSRVEVFHGDFLNRNDLRESLKDIEYVFHFISTTTPATAESDPLIDVETNIRMSIELFQECVEAKNIKKVVFASTGGAIYGTSGDGNAREDTLPLPVSPYAIGKLTIEHYLHYFNVRFGLNSVTYRISNPYGSRQSLTSKQGVIPIFLQHIAKHEPIHIMGDGSMTRDFIYVKDAVRMITESFEGAKESVYNIGSGLGIDLNDLVDIIKRVVETDVKVEHIQAPSTFVQKVVLDTTRFTNEFGDVKQTDIFEGIRQTWKYILEKT